MTAASIAYPSVVADTQNFFTDYFAEVDLGHQSRNRCFQRVATQISRHPGGTLPDKLSDPNDYIAMDRLMNRPEVTHASVLAPHRQRTLEKMRAQEGVVLILHDTTVLDYSGKKAARLGDRWQRQRPRLPVPQLAGRRSAATRGVGIGVADFASTGGSRQEGRRESKTPAEIAGKSALEPGGGRSAGAAAGTALGGRL